MLPVLCLQKGADLLLAAVDYLLQHPGAQEARVAVLHNAAASSPPSGISQLVQAALQLPSRRSKLPGGLVGSHWGLPMGRASAAFLLAAGAMLVPCSAMPWSALSSTASQERQQVTSVVCQPAARSDQHCSTAVVCRMCLSGCLGRLCLGPHSKTLQPCPFNTPVGLTGCQHNDPCSISLQQVPCHEMHCSRCLLDPVMVLSACL